MIPSFKKAIKKNLPFVITFRNRIRFLFYWLNSKSYEIEDATTLGKIFFELKPSSIEDIPIPRSYNFLESSVVKIHCSPLNCYQFSNAFIFSGSDFIMTDDKVFWEKTNYKNFSHIIPLDYHLISYDGSNIRIKKRPISRTVENGFSLLGFAPFNWSHFLFQYYPKLDALVKIKENFNDVITIIIRKDLDLHTKQLINDFTSRINNLTILEVDFGEKILCRNLFYVSNTSFIADSSNCMYFYNEIVPKYTLDFLRRAVLEVKKNHLSMVDDSSNKFLFLGRKGTRNIVNYSEVESFFHQAGFITIFPDELSLKEKVHLFHNASMIAGPGSSAFSNLIFCQPKTKVLFMINFKRISEPLIGYIIAEFNLDGILLSGLDIVDNDNHSDYLITMEELNSCYEQLSNF
jgi:hypothetical protein